MSWSCSAVLGDSVLKPLQQACCPPVRACPMQAHLSLADGETEAQNGIVVLQGHRVRIGSSFRFPTPGAQLPYLPRNRAEVGWGCSGMVLQRLQSTAVAGWGDPQLAHGNDDKGGKPGESEEPPGSRAPW